MSSTETVRSTRGGSPGIEFPNRQSIRKKGWDYTAPGWYFITINTKGGTPLFGTIMNGRMVLNKAGQVAEKCWQEIPAHFPEAKVDEFVIMPNHMHGIMRLKGLDMSSPCGGHDAAEQKAIEDGRLLIVSPFDDSIGAPSSQRAVWCNQYVLAHCDRLLVGHMNPGGMLSCILCEADPEKEIMYL